MENINKKTYWKKVFLLNNFFVSQLLSNRKKMYKIFQDYIPINEETKILDIAHRVWKDDDSKLIINFSSRASQPNISKGHLYASQKASLNHLSNNLTYNSDKKYKLTTINLGLLNHNELPSLTWQDVSGLVFRLITSYPSIEIPEITIQSFANYQEVQNEKAKVIMERPLDWQ